MTDELGEALAFLNGPEPGALTPRLRPARRRRGGWRRGMMRVGFLCIHAALLLAALIASRVISAPVGGWTTLVPGLGGAAPAPR